MFVGPPRGEYFSEVGTCFSAAAFNDIDAPQRRRNRMEIRMSPTERHQLVFMLVMDSTRRPAAEAEVGDRVFGLVARKYHDLCQAELAGKDACEQRHCRSTLCRR